jgi:hypothetical protein
VDGSLRLEIRESLDFARLGKGAAADSGVGGGRPDAAEAHRAGPDAVSIERACSDFIADAESRELQESTHRKYRQLTKQMKAFAAQEGPLFLKQWEPRGTSPLSSTLARQEPYRG